MSRRRQAEGQADRRLSDGAIADEQTRVRDLQPLDDPPTVPSYRDPIVSLDPDEAVTWNESMDEAWSAEPTRDRLRARPAAELFIDDPPTVTDVTRRQPRRPPSRPPDGRPRPEPARPLPPIGPPAQQPAPSPSAMADDSPWMVDEASFSNTIQPGERRVLPGDVLPAHGSTRPRSSRPPSMAAPASDGEVSQGPRPIKELHPAERRLMPPDSLPPGPASSMPPPLAAVTRSPSAWPEGRGGTLSQILGAPPRLRSILPKALMAIAVMAIALGAILWLLL